MNTEGINILEAIVDKNEKVFLGSRRLNILHFAHETAICSNSYNPSKSDSITNTPPVQTLCRQEIAFPYIFLKT